MSNKFMVIGTSSCHLVDGISRFCQFTNWEPILWTCGFGDFDIIRKKFPNTSTLNVFDLACGDLELMTKELGFNLLDMDPLLPKFHDEYAKERLMVIENLLHRADPGGAFLHSEIRDLVNNYFILALNLIVKFKPAFVFFEVPPHLMYDLAIYYVAKKHGIKTLMLIDTNMAEVSFGTFSISEPYPFVTVPLHVQKKNTTIREKITNQFNNQKNNRPFYMPNKKYTRSTWLMIRQSYGLIVNWLFSLAQPLGMQRKSYEKISGILLHKKSGRSSSIIRQFWNYCILETFYKKISRGFPGKKMDSIKPFVYVPLSLQHERTTMPCAEFMYNQKAYIQAIKSVLPTGFNIVIKENPKQFDYGNLNGITNRDREFYTDLMGENVFFAPLDFSTNDLISNSHCVAVTTGSAGFEAIVGYQVPAVCFSKNWYSHLEGATVIKSVLELKNFFEQLSSGCKSIDPNKLQTQLLDLAHKALYLWPEGATVSENNWDQDAMAHNLCELLKVVADC